MNRKIKKVSVNKGIRAPEVRVINPEGKQLGIISLKEALRIAEEEGLDLVEVAPNSLPPVCRIMDYGKFKYQQSKKAHEAKKTQTTIQVKEVKIRPKTEEHDFQYKLRHIKRFLMDGNKAKVHIIFRGREITHSNMGIKILNRIAEEVKDIGTIEQKPKLEGRNMAMIIAPKT
ncbi:MAG: translation initiation factor IF-3 [Thermodesulfobacteriota bacterium]|nr:translation initiation factor IF-3 [Thermodesulfobacteriota bacterium]